MIRSPMQTLHAAALIKVFIEQLTKAPTDDSSLCLTSYAYITVS